jgi:hypothetical protein
VGTTLSSFCAAMAPARGRSIAVTVVPPGEARRTVRVPLL